MPLPIPHAGRRSIHYDNLLLSALVVATSFVAYLYLLTPDGLYELTDDALARHGENSKGHTYQYAYMVAQGTGRLTLPGTTLNHSFLVGGAYGVVDGVRKVEDFFTRPTLLPPRRPRDSNTALRSGTGVGVAAPSLSDLVRWGLLKDRLGGPVALEQSGTASEVFRLLHIVHLCSASSCVGPALSLMFARQTREKATSPMIVEALLYGEPSLVCLVGEELAQNGVRVPWQTRLLPADDTVAQTQSMFPVRRCANDGHFTLFGSSEGNGTLHVVRSSNGPRSSGYTVTQVMASAHTEPKQTAGMVESSTATRAGPLLFFSPVGEGQLGLHPGNASTRISVVPLRDVALIQAWRRTRSSLHAAPADLVSAVDVDPVDSGGIAAYLAGLSRELAGASGRATTDGSFARPQNILLPVHATEWAVPILAHVDALRSLHNYSVVILWCPPSSGGSHCPQDRFLAAEDMARLQEDFAVATAAFTSLPGTPFQRYRTLGSPLLVLLTHSFSSVEELASLASQPGRRKGEGGETIHDAADRFFAPQAVSDAASSSSPPTDPRVARADLLVDPLDPIPPLSGSLGRTVYRTGLVIAKVLLYGLPVTICVFLIFNVTKSWRRRR